MVKRILFPIDGGADSVAAADQVIVIARAHGAFVTAMAVVDRPGIERALRPMGIGVSHLAHDAREWLLRENEREAEGALGRFAERLTAARVDNVQVEEFAGPVDAIVAESRFFDLVVMGERALSEDQPEDESAVLRDVVRRSVTPVLAVPAASAGRPVRHVLVCFDGSAQATRALQAWARLSPFGTTPATTVLAVAESDEAVAAAQLAVDRAAGYLQAWGHAPFVKHDVGRPKVVIPEFVAANGVDVIVMGAYGSGGLRDVFFGSLTTHLVRATDVMLFLAH